MIDIDLCAGTNCKLKHTCKRYLEWQDEVPEIAWWLEPSYKDGKCKNKINK